MFVQILSEQEQNLFLEAAWLTSLIDNPLLWGGKTEDEITGETDLSNVTFQHDKAERAVLDGFLSECQHIQKYRDSGVRGWGYGGDMGWMGWKDIENSLIKKLKSLPISKQNDPVHRQKIAEAALSELFPQGIKFSSPAATKIMLYELLLLALADGEISGTESALIKQFTAMHQIDDDTYADVLERAESMNREAVKTLSLILE